MTEQSAVALQEKGTVMGQSAAVLRGSGYEQGVSVVVLSVRIMRRKCRAAVLPEALVMVMKRQSREAGRSRDGYEEAPRRRSGQDGQREFRMNVGSRRRIVVGRKRSSIAQPGTAWQRYEEDGRGAGGRGHAQRKNRFFSEKDHSSHRWDRLGIIIVLLVVITIFGGKIFSKLASGGNTTTGLRQRCHQHSAGGTGWPGDVEGSRSDSMMLVSVNKGTGKVKIVSLMRDMYVSIPGMMSTGSMRHILWAVVKLLSRR